MNKALSIFIVTVLLICACKKDKKIEPEKQINGFLSERPYEKMIVEVAYATGMQPAQQCLDNVKVFLTNLMNKPQGIEFNQREINASTSSAYSLEQLQDLEKQNRSVFNKGKVAAVYIFFAGGDYDQNGGNSKVLGIAYGSSSIVMFEKTIRGLSGGLTQPSTASVETSVLEHEFGHLLGLVNNGIMMNTAHQDEAHGKHCDNSKCLMYYASETSDVIANLLGTGVPSLDDNCLSDLRSGGGK
jgi:hypothetical protein